MNDDPEVCLSVVLCDILLSVGLNLDFIFPSCFEFFMLV